jgi:CelD/BcsL family acetyltransferase involved in cellulose biosynthesis
VLVERTEDAPLLEMDGDGFDAWFAARPARFRERMRRTARRLAAAGGVVAPTASVDDLPADVGAFLALHRARFAGRASALHHPGTQAMLEEAGRALLPRGRFHLWNARLPDRPIAAAVHVSAGGVTGAWAIGWDETASALSPGIVIVLNVVEEAFGRGDRRFDMGAGASAYKDRFANADAPLAWVGILATGPAGAAGRGVLAAEALRHGAAARVKRDLPRIEAVARRVRRPRGH